MEYIGLCWHCRKPLGKADYGRETLCLGCTKSTRVCRNCIHYAPGRPNDCLEPMAERVLDKTNSNHCEFFEPNPNPEEGSGNDPGKLLAAADSLFK